MNYDEFASAFVSGAGTLASMELQENSKFVAAATPLPGLEVDYNIRDTLVEFHFWPADEGQILPEAALQCVQRFSRGYNDSLVDLAKGVCRTAEDTTPKESIYFSLQAAMAPTPYMVERILSKLAATL